MTEPSDADHSVIEVLDIRADRLARPQVFVPRIMRTDFRDLNSTYELSCYFDVLGQATVIAGCLIPLGHFNGVTYLLYPMSSILQLQDKVQDQQSAEPAPASYFCVKKQNLDQVGQLPWGGSSASPIQTRATKIGRTLSLRSVTSEDSGYASENAHPLSNNLLTISEGEVEQQAGFGLFDGRKESVKKRHRTFSLRSVSSEDSGYSSGDAHSVSKSLAAISEDRIDEHAKFGLLNKLKCESTIAYAISFPFFTLGRLYSKPTSSENHPTMTDFIVAVSLADFSLWAIFDAWDEDWIAAEEGDEVDWIGIERHETPLKPLWSNNWGNLPGLDGRVRMAKLANNVYAHIFAPTEQINWTNTEEQWGLNEIPVLFPAEKALTGPVGSLNQISLSNDMTKQTP